jgi:biopolymer transport protein ExbB
MAGAVLLAGAVVAAAENAPATPVTPEFESIIQDKEEVLKTQMEGTEPGDMRSITVVTDDNVSTLELGDVYKNNACYYKVTEIRSKGTSGGKFVVQRIGGRAAPGRKWNRVSGLGPLTIDSRESVLDKWFFNGGPIMYPIAALLLVTIIVLFNSLFVYRRGAQCPSRFILSARSALEKGDVDAFQRAAAVVKGLLPAVCRAMVSEYRTTTVEDMQTRGETEATRQIGVLRIPLKLLTFAAAVAPLLGLLGTVVGMVMCFDALSEEQASASKSQLLAAGIKVALLTTVAGLTTAIPALLVFFVFNQVLNSVIGQAQGQAMEFLHQLATIKRRAVAAARAKLGAPGPHPAEPAEGAAEGAHGAEV